MVINRYARHYGNWRTDPGPANDICRKKMSSNTTKTEQHRQIPRNPGFYCG